MKRVIFWIQCAVLLSFMFFAFIKATSIVYPVRHGRKADPQLIELQVKQGNISFREALFYKRLK